VRHFVCKFLRETKGITEFPMKTFLAWFKEIDKDGSGQIEMVNMAFYIKDLVKIF
jgi:hypothetical protein